jgi:hypothetical protein
LKSCPAGGGGLSGADLTSLGIYFFSSPTGVQVLCGNLSGLLGLAAEPLVAPGPADGGLAVPGGGGLAAPPVGVPERRGN